MSQLVLHKVDSLLADAGAIGVAAKSWFAALLAALSVLTPARTLRLLGDASDQVDADSHALVTDLSAAISFHGERAYLRALSPGERDQLGKDKAFDNTDEAFGDMFVTARNMVAEYTAEALRSPLDRFNSAIECLEEVAGGISLCGHWRQLDGDDALPDDAHIDVVLARANETLFSKENKGITRKIKSARATVLDCQNKLKCEETKLNVSDDAGDLAARYSACAQAVLRADAVLSEGKLLTNVCIDKRTPIAQRRHTVDAEMNRIQGSVILENIHPAIKACAMEFVRG